MSATILLTGLLTLLVLAGIFYTCFSPLCVLRFFHGRQPMERASDQYPPVSVLKPVKGLDASCSDNLSTLCGLDYPCYEVLFGLRDRNDSALPIIRRLIETTGGRARLVLTEDRGAAGANDKMLNCAGLAEESKYPLLVLTDSDMAVGKDFLWKIVGEYLNLKEPGMVTCLYKTTKPLSPGSALESLAIAVDSVPSVLVARRLEGVRFGLGAPMLFSKAALDDIGGFIPIAQYLADDYQLGFRVSQSGRRNELSRHVLGNDPGKMTVADHAIHQMRWARTQRASRPKGFLGYGITHTFVLSLLLIAAAPGRWSLALALLALALRYSLAIAIYTKVIQASSWLKWLSLLPFRDCLVFLIWLWSFAGSDAWWRGSRFTVRRGGKDGADTEAMKSVLPVATLFCPVIVVAGCTVMVPKSYLPPPLATEKAPDPVKVVAIPLPAIATTSNEGVTYGALNPFLIHDNNDEVTAVIAPQLTTIATSARAALFMAGSISETTVSWRSIFRNRKGPIRTTR
jgi:ceramide glucosyltransferase